MGERDPRDPLDEDAAWAEIVASYGEEPAFPAPEDRPSAPVSVRPEAGEPERPMTDLDLEKGLENWEKALGLEKSPEPGSEEKGQEQGPEKTSSEATSSEKKPEKGTDAERETAAEGKQPGAADGPGDVPPAGRSGDASGDRPGSFVVYAPGVGPRDWSAGASSDDDFDEDDEGHFTPPEPPPLPQADVTTKFAWIAVLGGPLLLILTMILQQPVTWWITTLGIGGFLGGFATLFARMKTDDEDDDPRPGGGAVV
ncbi:hypothetical protein [Streptomyces purpurogeneiscleroticus]|uniref:hypothetical protein n=1 Tax=Streptomyces purpurogeneiscleroticus TaxID=68259 RepID=UPI001CC0FE6F|nr:hypothetical protein [Streptomyces purpurogeneiscleroticus]MBZ4016956.1 hypothetical protein [Streptomyces purpurogeneiscleroticus]